MPKSNSEGAAKGAVSWKGIPASVLDAFRVTAGSVGWRVPYFAVNGEHYRTKLFPFDGEPKTKWLGESKPQIPYGAWRLPEQGKVVILTEGESDTLALATYLPKVPALGIPGASSWRPEWAIRLAGFDRVFISTDYDKPNRQGKRPGLELADRIFESIPDARFVQLPEGADTRAFLQRMGPRPYLTLLRASEVSAKIRRAFAAAAEPCAEAQRVRDRWQP